MQEGASKGNMLGTNLECNVSKYTWRGCHLRFPHFNYFSDILNKTKYLLLTITKCFQKILVDDKESF